MRTGRHPAVRCTDIGPVVDDKQLAQNLQYVAIVTAEGAKLVAGGEVIDRNGDGAPGYYMRSAPFAETTAAMRINRGEVFGPVVCVIRAKNYEEAMALANDPEFGLSAGIATTSLKHATRFKRHVEVGMMMVNLPTAGVDYHVPSAAAKDPATGRASRAATPRSSTRRSPRRIRPPGLRRAVAAQKHPSRPTRRLWCARPWTRRPSGEQPPLGQLTVGSVGECRQGGVQGSRAHQAVALRHRVLALAVAGPLRDTRT